MFLCWGWSCAVCWPNALHVQPKTLASSLQAKLCGGKRKTPSFLAHFFFFFLLLLLLATHFLHAASAAVLGPGALCLAARQLGSPAARPAAVCLLIQDNKCLSLGFRQLFTLSWRLSRGPGNWQSPTPTFCYFRLWLENVSICPGSVFLCAHIPISPFPHIPNADCQFRLLFAAFVPATVCIISALGFKVSAVALALICHLEVIFIYSPAKSSGNFMMTFRFQGFSRTLPYKF